MTPDPTKQAWRSARSQTTVCTPSEGTCDGAEKTTCWTTSTSFSEGRCCATRSSPMAWRYTQVQHGVYIQALIWDPAVLLMVKASRTSGGRRHRAGNKKMRGAELRLVSCFVFPEILYRRKRIRVSWWSVFLQRPVYTVLIWNLYRHFF